MTYRTFDLFDYGQSFRACFILVVFLFSTSASVPAQVPYNGTTPLGIAPGAAAGSFPLTDFDHVNLYNGRLSVHLPLLHIKGRGGAEYTATLLPLNATWVVQHQELGLGNSHNYPSYEWWEGGPGYGPGSMRGRRVTTPCELHSSSSDSVTRLTFTIADGTEYELIDSVYQGEPIFGPCTDDFNMRLGANRGRVFTTTDGSAATFISDVDIVDWRWPWSANFFPSGYLMLRNGMRYRIDQGNVSWIRDPNGNTLSFTYASPENGLVTKVKDSLNREVTFEYSVQDEALYGMCDRIKFKGTDGAERIIRVSRADMAQALAPGESIKQWFELFPETWGPWTAGEFRPAVVTKVWLPNDRTYQFLYNSYGEIARIVTPTGGAVEYEYGPGVGNAYANGLIDIGWDSDNPGGAPFMRQTIYRRVTARRTYPNGGTGTGFERRTVYGSGESQCGGEVVSGGTWDYAPDGTATGTLLRVTSHFFYGSPCGSLIRGAAEPTRSASWKEGKEYSTRIYDSNLTELTRVDREWRQRAEVTWEQHPSMTADMFPANDPRVVEVISTLEPATTNLKSKVSFINPDTQAVGFDQFNNPTDGWEYDFDYGSGWTLKRRAHTEYITDSTYINANVDPNLGAHIRGLVTLQQTFDAGGVERARTTFAYDNYTATSFNALLKPRANITGLCATVISPTVCDNTNPTLSVRRGNATALTKHHLTDATKSVTMFQHYDVAGNVVKTIDPRSTPSHMIVTEVDFTDRFGAPDNEAQSNSVPTGLGTQKTYAFATKHTNALGHVSYVQYDYYLGMPVNSEDPNGVVSSQQYGTGVVGGIDLLDRPSRGITGANIQDGPNTAIKQQVKILYEDSQKRVTITSDQANFDDNILKTQTIYDGFGRTIENRSFENSTDFIATKVEFDAFGRVRRFINPHRTTGDETYGWTITGYDALSRVTDIQTFDGLGSSTGLVHTQYLGNLTLVTDQAGNKRLSRMNAIGQLVAVWEVRPPDPATVSVAFGQTNLTGYLTEYEYDVLNNLTKVKQEPQPNRILVYNSLSQLTESTAPENGHQTFDYDTAGNLIHKTDARGVMATYDFDELNRLKSRSHSDGTPAVSYVYDTLPFGIGRLSTISSSISTYSFTQYDELGRVRSATQTTDGVVYGMGYKYNRTGALISETYPSDKEIKTEYDPSGRIAGIKNESSGVYYAGAAPSDLVNRMQYAATGGLRAMRLGNNLWENTKFNSLTQRTEIGLGTSSSDSSTFRLTYAYSATSNNGNIQSQTLTLPNLTLLQTFTYDELNRLNSAIETNGTNENWKQTFTYDRFGNRRFNRDHTTFPQITDENQATTNPVISPDTNKITATGYRYDLSGNLECDPDHPCGSVTPFPPYYTYDGENRVKSAAGGSASGGSDYFYDGSGRRVKKIVGSGPNAGTTVFVYNTFGKLIAEYSNASQLGSNGTSYVTADHLDTPRVITGANGAVIGRYDYMPFGEAISSSSGGRFGVVGYSSVDTLRQKFTSKERDKETGFDYFGARYYSSIYGRFISADESLVDQQPTSPQSWNLYVYGANNPLRFNDPDGLAHWDKNGNFVGDYDGEYNNDLQAVWNKKGRYWDFEKGKKVWNMLWELSLSIQRGNEVINEVQLKMFNDWLEAQGNRPQPIGGTLVLFGPIMGASRLLGPATQYLQLGTARMNLLNTIQNPALRKLVEYTYRVSARIGNGSTADAIRFEKETGILLSRTGHIQKGKEVLTSLERLLGSNKLNPKDAEIARELIKDMKDALSK